jgi:hypothetical protein
MKLLRFARLQLFGSLGGIPVPGAPQHTWPQSAGMPGLGMTKSGVIPPTGLCVAMIQRRFTPPVAMSPGTTSRSPKEVPAQSQAASTEFVVTVCPPDSITISTYCSAGSSPPRALTSAMCAR